MRARILAVARRAGAAVLVLVVLGLLGATIWLRRSLPTTSGEARGPGLRARLEIVRDAHGVPTIRAQSEEDAAYGLGYAHAQDRFFQMEVGRRTGQGRLSELFGADQLRADRGLRRGGFYRAAQRAEQALLPSTREILRAYSAGVNAWLSEHSGSLPAELVLARWRSGSSATPEPWSPADSIVWAKMMAYGQSVSAAHLERLRARVNTAIGPERASDLFPAYEGPAILGGNGVDASRPFAFGDTRARFGADDSDPFERFAFTGIGSNSWVIAGSRSESGRPLVANDAHLPVESPSTWYVARIELPSRHAVGLTLPGLPVVVVGRNDRIAWGITNLSADTQDHYVERALPSAPAMYLTADGPRPFTTRTELIKVAGRAKPEELTVRETIHGPVLREGSTERAEDPLSVRWPGFDDRDTSLDAMLAVERAGSWSEFTRALERLVTPALSFVYADVDGHIGYVAAGRIPVRKREGSGQLPTPGWEADVEWTGYVPFDRMPRTLDPSAGFVVTANNLVSSQPSAPYLGTSWAAPYRARRIADMIGKKPKLTTADVMEMQRDVTSGLAIELLPVLLSAVAPAGRERDAIERLRRWGGVASADSPEAAIFVAWYSRLVPKLVKDDIGEELLGEYGTDHPKFVARALSDPTAAWCDDHATSAHESCADVLLGTLREALDDLTTRLGPQMDGWRLDTAREVRFASRVGGSAPFPLGRLYRRVGRIGGDSATVRVASISTKPANTVQIASAYFAVFDVGADGESRIVLPMGQSEHPLSPYFDDQLASWERAESVVVAGGGTSTLVLTP